MTPFYHSSPPPRPSAPLVQHISSDKKRPSFEHRDSSPSPFLPSSPYFSSSICTAVSNFNYPHPRARKKKEKEKEKENDSPKINRTLNKRSVKKRSSPTCDRAVFWMCFEINFFPLPSSSPVRIENWRFLRSARLREV